MADEPFTYRYFVSANQGADIEIFESNVEYLPRDELPLSSARYVVDTVDALGPQDVETQLARILRCTIKS